MEEEEVKKGDLKYIINKPETTLEENDERDTNCNIQQEIELEKVKIKTLKEMVENIRYDHKINYHWSWL